MAERYTIESTDHRAHMTAHEDGQWMAKADYEALAADLDNKQRESEESSRYLSDRIARLEAAGELLAEALSAVCEKSNDPPSLKSCEAIDGWVALTSSKRSGDAK